MYRFLFFFLLCSVQLFAQRKELKALRIDEKLKIDGNLDESVWKDAPSATDFIEFQPNNGQTEHTQSPTFVKVLYDDTSIYFGIELVDSKMDSINKQLSNRDSFGNEKDWFLIMLNPFNDQQQYFEFGVTAAGVQFDAFATQGSGEDWNWNAIWESAVTLENDHWFVEVKLPYSAFRFPKKSADHWQLNFVRNYGKNRKKFTWDRIDNNKGTVFQYNGDLTNLENINPPTRLFFIPYLSNYLVNSEGRTHNTVKGGMDLNWGINQSYTLDAILIPDFGQTAFDNVQYVLGPFEQQFSDKRPFFTDGMDLFTKGDLLYTRRIGAAPSFYPDLSDNEEVTEYPSETPLLNALKVSGRNDKGIGIGMLNAITDKVEATIVNQDTNESRKEIVNPYTNYNELVIDKRFKDSNSSISLVNASTLRNGSFRDANATAFLADLYDKESKYNWFTSAKYSYVHDTQNKTGYRLSSSFTKDFGKNRYGGGGSYVSKDYDINDLGINFYSDYWDFYIFFNNQLLESNEFYNSKNINTNLNGRFDNTTGKPYYFQYNFNFNSTNKKNNYNGFGVGFVPIKTYDFYEPRVKGRYSENPKEFNFWFYNSPNYSKKFLIDKNIWGGWQSFRNQYYYGVDFTPRYRPSDKLLLILSASYEYNSHDRGWVNQVDDDIIFGERNRKTLTTNINGSYYFNPLTSLSLNFRHYYTNAKYLQFLNLNEDGSYTPNQNYNENHDFTFNTWNMDLKFSWWFAPGSQMEILYRNTFDSYNDIAVNNLPDNFQFLFNQPITQIFSFRITYFLDYNKAKTFVQKRKNRNVKDIQSKLPSIIQNNQNRKSTNYLPRIF